MSRCIFTLLFLSTPALLWAQSYTLTTFAGADRLGDGKQATAVPLRDPAGVAQDAAGNMYIADRADHRIRRVAPDGVITTIAGTGRAGFTGDGGPAIAAQLNRPSTVRLDGTGNLYIADYDNLVVRKLNLITGIITTVAGDGSAQFGGDGVPATRSGMAPFDIAIDSDGNLYIADGFNHRIRKVTASTGLIQTIAGIGRPGFSGDQGAATSAALNFPLGVAVDPQKNVYIADYSNARVRKISSITGVITTLAGIGIQNISSNGGLAVNAAILYPFSVAIEANGDILIGGDYDVRRITLATGIIRNVAPYFSDPGFAGDGGFSDIATWSTIGGLGVAPNGDILVSDNANYRVRRIRSSRVNTVAGVGLVNDVDASKAVLSGPAGLGFNATGGLMFADRLFNQIRSVDAGRVTKVLGDGYPTASVQRTTRPEGIARDRFGTIYIADTGNNRILKLLANGIPSNFAGGRGYGFNGTFGQAGTIALAAPRAVITDADGVVYIADTDNCRVRKVTEGLLSTIAGTGKCIALGDNGPALEADLIPMDIALDGKGGLLIADANHRIRRIDLTTGIITTIAGIGTAGHSGDGELATLAQIDDPRGIAVDAAGRIYFTEYGTSMVRMIQDGVVRTIAGTGDYVSSAESGPATGVAFDPTRLIVDPNGAIYVSDEYNDRIRKLTLAVVSSLQVVQGAGASGEPGNKITVQVRAVEASGVAVSGVPIRFQVTAGSAAVSSLATNTTGLGIAQVQLTLGDTLGPVTLTASSEGLPSVTVNLLVVAPAVPVPQLDEAAVVGAGLSVPAVRSLSAGGIMTAFGKNFGVGAAFRKVGNADLVGGKVPTNFAGICVDVSGARAPVFGASDTQVNFQAPAGLSGNVSIKVISGCGTANEKSTNAITVAAQAASPEFFYFQGSADGHNPVAATNTITGALLASANLFPASGIQPAKPGTYVTVYATGFGETDPGFTPGDFPAGIGRAKGAVRVLLNGQVLAAESVLYAGVTPNSPGLFQLNLLLPANTSPGDLSLVIEIGGIQSPAGAYLTVAP